MLDLFHNLYLPSHSFDMPIAIFLEKSLFKYCKTVDGVLQWKYIIDGVTAQTVAAVMPRDEYHCSTDSLNDRN